MSDDLEGMATFVAVAEAKGFRAAAKRLGITGSAVSQAIRRLESRLGMAIVHRTTRSVRLTEAGERLYAAVHPALEQVRVAVAAAGELADQPRGTLHLHATTGAQSYFDGPLLADFLNAHPQVRLDLSVSEVPVDIVAGGYDAGVRLGEVIDRDMIAVPVSGDIRLVVVAAPSYFARHPKPAHPRDLAEHECVACIQRPMHPSIGGSLPRKVISRSPPARVSPLISHQRPPRVGRYGVTMREDRSRRDRKGRPRRVLDKFCAPFPGYYLYYSQRRQASPALRAFVDFASANAREKANERAEERRLVAHAGARSAFPGAMPSTGCPSATTDTPLTITCRMPTGGSDGSL
jgi:DNA-binding transcriptional LysR family regulator